MRVAFAAALLATVASIPALADTGRGALRVSVQVTRSCRVATAGSVVTVGCGMRPQRVQIRHDGRTTAHTLTGATPVAPASAKTVTVDF
jgi:hypothetical protein